MGSSVWGLKGVWSLGFRVEGLGFRVWNLSWGVKGVAKSGGGITVGGDWDLEGAVQVVPYPIVAVRDPPLDDGARRPVVGDRL